MCFAFDGSDWVPTEFYEGEDIWANLRKDAQFDQWIKEVNEIVKEDSQIYGLILRLTKGVETEETSEEERTQKAGPKEIKESQEKAITKFWADGPVGEFADNNGK